MFNHAKNLTFKSANQTTAYIRFGHGPRNLVIIPGLSDGLKTVKNTAHVMAIIYAKWAKDYRVYMVSRPFNLKEGTTIEQMADYLYELLAAIGINQTSLLGISQGGMIGQIFAIKYPHMLDKLILAVTSSHANQTITNVISNWAQLIKDKQYRLFLTTSFKQIYSPKVYRRRKLLVPLARALYKTSNDQRYMIQSASILNFDNREQLQLINTPTLIIEGQVDQVVGPNASELLIKNIKGAKIHYYPHLGHSLYEEAKDFTEIIAAFLKQ